MSHDGGSSCKSYIKHPTEKERLDNLAFTSFPEDYLPYTSSYHRKAPYLVWDDGFRPHRKRRLKRWRESKACRCCTAAALTAAISLIIIGILSIVAVSIYLGVITSLFRSPILSLSGKMSVVEGDEFTDALLNTTTYEFLAKAETYQAMLQNTYLSSSLEPAFVAAKVYAFRKGSLIVFFRLYLDRRKLLHSDEETVLIARNVILEHAVKQKPEFSALSLDLNSVEIKENSDEQQTPEMDFDFREDSRRSESVPDDETEHLRPVSHMADSEGKTEYFGDAQNPTPAETDVNLKISSFVNEENPSTTPHSYWRTNSENISTPSHVSQHEKLVLPENPPSKKENISIAYGQWQPLVPLRDSAVENISTRKPSQKDHRRISGSGSVHLVEDLFIPVVSQTLAPHSTPLPAVNAALKPQPNVASTIMSSVSLVIRPSSKNRTVMVTNNKNNVIETAIKVPTQQVANLKLHGSSHTDPAVESKTGNISLLGTRNNHASLRFIEDFDKRISSPVNADKTYSSVNDSSKAEIHLVSAKETSQLSSEGLKTVESKLPSKILPGNFPEPLPGGHNDSELFTQYSKEGDDRLNSNTVSTEFSFLAENVSSGDVPMIYSVTERNEIRKLSITPFALIPNFTAMSTTNLPHSPYVILGDTKESSSISEEEIGFTSVTATNPVETINLDYDSRKTIKRFESEAEYADTLYNSTNILSENHKFYVTDNDSYSSGSLDVNEQTPVDEISSPKINVTLSEKNLHMVTKVPLSSLKNGTVYNNRLSESPKNTHLENMTSLNDPELTTFIGNLSQQNEDNSDLPYNSNNNNNNNNTKGADSSINESENRNSNPDSGTTSVSILEVRTNETVHVNLNKQDNLKSNIYIMEATLNGSNIPDSKTGGLPKIVPPFSNTQYIPNDIHSDTDINKNDNHLDDVRLFPVTFSDMEIPEVQPSDKPQTVMNKDSLDEAFQRPDEENVVIHHITTPLTVPENDSTVVGLGKYPTYFLNKCSDDEIACRSGECIPADYQCNMRRDCRDNSDEDQCSCSDNLKVIGQTQKICDGIQDCLDLSDEENCSWCTPGQFICPQSRLCIDMNQICDGSNDCPFGTDERYCVKLADDEIGANSAEYQPTGYLMIRKRGQWGKLCLENLHNITQPENLKVKLGELGHAVCSALSYKEITEATETKDETQTKQSYFEISTQSAKKQGRQYTDIFAASECQSKSVVHVTCKSLECGMRPMAFSLRRRIVGGHSTSSGSWPWQVALYKEGDFQCGAVLVSNMWLISAGHCFYSSQNSHWVARLGVLRRGTELPSPSEQVRRITHIFIHPDYVDKGFINDIALLRMESPVPFSDFLRPLCLPNETEEVNMWHGHHCTVVGWGKLYEVGHTFPDSLQEVRLPVISTEECRKKILFLTMYHLTENMFCAGYERGGRDACLGDSGGPLMCQRQDGRWVLLGVTSNGDGCGRPGRPGVYTKVTKYLTWIKQVIDGDLPPERSSTCAGHRCTLGHCVLESKVCDGHWDCSDGSDERNCFT